MGSAQKARIDP